MDFSICVDAVFGGKDLGESLKILKRLGFKGRTYIQFNRW